MVANLLLAFTRIRRGWRDFGRAAKGEGEFWRLVGGWWYRENVSVPEARERREVRRSVKRLFCEEGEVVVWEWGTGVIAGSVLSAIDLRGWYPEAKGYWLIGKFQIHAEVVPSRIGRFIARVLFGVRWVSSYYE